MAYTAEKAYQLIESAHQRGRLAHAFLITGEAGSGKSELAARVISLVNPPGNTGGMNLFGEVEAPVQKSLDELEGELVRVVRPRSKSRAIRIKDMRDLEKSFHVASAPGQWKVGVIVHADRMNESAENAFLKTLEEPPPNSLLLLLSDDPDRLLPTILSRCVTLPLISSSAGRQLSDTQKELLTQLSVVSKRGWGDIASAMTLRGAFSSILAKRRLELTKLNEQNLKEELAHYKNTTDAEHWLKEREDFYKAQIESDCLGEQEQLLDVLVSWMGDVVRSKCSADRLDFPSEKVVTMGLAQQHELADLLQRMEAVEELHTNLQTNVQVQLALEVAFLKAFG